MPRKRTAKNKNKVEYGKARSRPSCTTDPKDLGPIISAPLDTKMYKAIELTNGMKSFLVSTCQHKLDLEDKCKYQRIQEFNKKYAGINEREPSSSSSPSISTGKSSCCGCGDDDTEEITSNCGSEGNKSCPPKKPKRCCKDLASACIVVGVGSFSDPVDVQGMSHFCEHNLLLGSTKFTEEGLLFKLVHQFGGYINAMTLAEYTCYFFTCESSQFENVLEVFSDMIARPLLRASSILKEVSAIDSEFSIIETSDMTRASDFLSFLAQPDHPFFTFNWGNRQSLADKDLHSKLVSWQARHYGANYTTLCLQGPFPTDQLEKMASKYFSSMKSNCCESPKIELLKKGDPYVPDTFAKMYELVPTSNIKTMLISWCLPPDIWQDFQSNPLLFLKTILNHESEGGICDYLRKKHWITRFGSGCSKKDTRSRSSFASIYRFFFCLTEEGFKNRDKIINALHSYIKFLINEEGRQAKIYDELKRTQASVFHYHDWEEKLESTLDYALALQTVPPKYVLTSKTLITDDYDALKFGDILKLMSPQKANIIVMAREFADEKEQINIMNRRFVYKIKPLPLEITNCRIYRDFKLPSPDVFLSQDLGLPNHPNNFLSIQEDMKTLYQDPDGKFVITYTQEFKSPCNTSRLPYGIFDIGLNSPLATLANKPLMSMWIYLLNLSLGKEFKSSYSSLYSYHINLVGNVLKLQVEGPSFHLTDLLEKVLKVFHEFKKHMEEDRKYFEDEKTELLEAFDNDMLHIENYPQDILNFILEQNGISMLHDKLKLKRTSYGEFYRFVNQFTARMFIDVDTFGSVTPEQVEDIKRIVNGIGSRAYRKPLSLAVDRATLLPLGCSVLRIRHKNMDYHTSTVLNHYQFGMLKNDNDVAIWRLLHSVLSATAFLQLRTKEQLGYRVKLSKWTKHGCRGLDFRVITQPDYYTTEHVNFRMDIFLQAFFKFHFKTAKTFKDLISTYTKKLVSYKRAKDMYMDYLLPQGSEYRKLSIQLVGHKISVKRSSKRKYDDEKDKPWLLYQNMPSRYPNAKDKDRLRFIQDVEDFKASLQLQPNTVCETHGDHDLDDF